MAWRHWSSKYLIWQHGSLPFVAMVVEFPLSRQVRLSGFFQMFHRWCWGSWFLRILVISCDFVKVLLRMRVGHVIKHVVDLNFFVMWGSYYGVPTMPFEQGAVPLILRCHGRLQLALLGLSLLLLYSFSTWPQSYLHVDITKPGRHSARCIGSFYWVIRICLLNSENIFDSENSQFSWKP